jgi:hypothetical protein
MPSLTVPGPYPSEAAAFMDQVILQTVYRTLSFVPIPFSIADGYDAAVWLSQNGRGGTLTWKVPGSVFLWTKCIVAPGTGGATTEDLWVFGGVKNTVLVRRFFWTNNLPIGGGQLIRRFLAFAK